MMSCLRKRAREEDEVVETEAPVGQEIKRGKFGDVEQKSTEDGMKPTEDKLEVMQEEEIRRIEALYADLPPLPPEVPQPDYLIQDQPRYSQDKGSLAFYSACTSGDLPQVCDYIDIAQPSHADRQYGLEKAAHAFQIRIVRYLMQNQGTKIHTLVFQIHKNNDHPVQSLFGNNSVINGYLWGETRRWPKDNVRLAVTNIFASGCSRAECTHYLDALFHTGANKSCGTARTIFDSGSPKLLSLLQVFLDNGWHPNQILGPPQEVALHHVQCVRDTRILKLLLDHGADPTIARKGPRSMVFLRHPWKAPVQRKIGDVLDMAAKVASTEAIDLLLAHGAKFEYGRALQCLVEFRLLAGAAVDSTRFEMAEHLIQNGEDINGHRDVYDAIQPHSVMTVGIGFKATPLSHAKGSQDWGFVQWLLEKGADPQAHDGRAFDGRDKEHYGLTYRQAFDKNQARLSNLVQKVKDRKERDNEHTVHV
ncbi:hypothetical protein PG985_004314 [Apiospora marii]|uniref:uncharacterized protein n=1 Tax=Apiospora marii TaxID=335849 RepID=UPI0031313873